MTQNTSEGLGLRNLRLEIAYDGTDFYGWQRQPDQPTIQGLIESAIERISREEARVIGAGRTDAGVHAVRQVASFKTATPIPCQNLKRALNDVLPPTIRVLAVREAAPPFHARYDATAKLYRYRILNREVCPPFLARFVHHRPGELDVDSMRRAARLLVGEHDFTSFAAADSRLDQDNNESDARRPSAVRAISSSRIIWHPGASMLVYEVQGDGFLRHMVRNIAGTLIEAGRGALAADDISGILRTHDRAAAGPTAPACGLWLIRVDYKSV
ncbi:MAG: tRNA pseudouridine(38-40) synthase TruA [Terriglobia bacterium]